MIIKFLIISCLSLLIAYKFFNISSLDLLITKTTPLCGMFGIIGCFALGATGTIKGIANIARSLAGGSIKFPKIGSKAILGIVFCEANFMYSIIHCIMMNLTLKENMNMAKQHLLMACGLVVGISTYCSSVSTGIICGAITVMDAKEPRLFSKLVPMELISSSIGLLGMVIGFVLNEKIKSL